MSEFKRKVNLNKVEPSKRELSALVEDLKQAQEILQSSVLSLAVAQAQTNQFDNRLSPYDVGVLKNQDLDEYFEKLGQLIVVLTNLRESRR